MRKVSALFFFILVFHFAKAQQYAIVIKGGHLIDPKNSINEVMDIAVTDGKIRRVAKNIDTAKAI